MNVICIVVHTLGEVPSRQSVQVPGGDVGSGDGATSC